MNGQWRGFGAGVGCKNSNDLTNFENVKYGQFHRIGLINGRTYSYIDQATQLPATRTYAQEIVNYANWFAYYRLRAHAAKTTSSLSFNLLDNTYRVGFQTLGQEAPPVGPSPATNPPVWVDVNDFNPGAGQQKNKFWNALFAVPTVTTVKTPTLSAMLRIGNLYETGSPAGLPASIYPLPAGAQDPFAKDSSGNVISCQSNYHILFTDGATNQVALPAVAGDQDQSIPATLPLRTIRPIPDKVLPDLRVALWPPPFKQGTPAVPGYLVGHRDVLLGARSPSGAQGRRAGVVGQDAERHRPDQGRRVVAARPVLGDLLRRRGNARRRRTRRRRSPPSRRERCNGRI